VQRFFDIIFSLLALLILCPLLLPILIVLKLTGEGEVFFLQKRVGKGAVPFNLFKFATMLKDSPNLGSGTVTLKSDPRVLPVGKFLRKTKINELPQLLNILFGDMSIVGPRPQTVRCFDVFPGNLKETITKIRPGLSGLGPIVFRDEENILAENEESVEYYDHVIAPYKGRVEAWYVENQSLRSYFAIIFITVWVILFPSSSLVWQFFKGMPKPPKELSDNLNFTSQ
jgi:lipopolysaccharide/colanic/teichoic acid biosynthesis glycosyltransferase